MVIYDYAINMEWKCMWNGDDEVKEGFIEGNIFMPEVSNDVENDGEEFDV